MFRLKSNSLLWSTFQPPAMPHFPSLNLLLQFLEHVNIFLFWRTFCIKLFPLPRLLFSSFSPWVSIFLYFKSWVLGLFSKRPPLAIPHKQLLNKCLSHWAGRAGFTSLGTQSKAAHSLHSMTITWFTSFIALVTIWNFLVYFLSCLLSPAQGFKSSWKRGSCLVLFLSSATQMINICWIHLCSIYYGPHTVLQILQTTTLSILTITQWGRLCFHLFYS